MVRSRQALSILLLGLAAVAAWSFARPWLPKAAFAESSGEANRIRLEAWEYEPRRPNVLVGSSFSGRLLPEDFKDSPLDPISNLAFDGSGPEVGLRLLAGQNPPPKNVLLEVHRVSKAWTRRDADLLASRGGPGDWLRRSVPGLRANTRPSTLLFSWVKSHRGGGRPVDAFAGEATEPTGPVVYENEPDCASLARVLSMARDLSARGSRVALVRLPVGTENPPATNSADAVSCLAAAWEFPLLDVNREATRRGMVMAYTDGRHLDAPSARAAARILADLAASLPARRSTR